MRVVRRTLLAAACSLVLAASAAAGIPAVVQTTSYPWVQPYTHGLVMASVQPVVSWTVPSFRASNAYVWAQRDGVSQSGELTQPPAWVPAG